MSSRPPIPVSLRSGTLAVFDPRALDHRRAADKRWMKDEAEVRRELGEGNLAAVDLEGQGACSVRMGPIPEKAQRAGPYRLRVTSGSIYFGDLQDAPSKRWGRRWNAWTVSLGAFVLSLVPFGFWLTQFDRSMIFYIAFGSVFTLAFMIPLSRFFFPKGETNFARNTGTPPGDHPEAVVAVEPGDYAVTFGRADPLRPIVYVELSREVAVSPSQELPRLTASGI
jgi:hypothetical protein